MIHSDKKFPQITFQSREIPLITTNSHVCIRTCIYRYIHCLTMACSSYCIMSAHKPPCYSISNSTKQPYPGYPGFSGEGLSSDIQAEIQTFSPSRREGDGRFKLISTILPKSKQFSTLRKHFCKGNEYAMRLRKSETSFECLASCQHLGSC